MIILRVYGRACFFLIINEHILLKVINTLVKFNVLVTTRRYAYTSRCSITYCFYEILKLCDINFDCRD